MRRFNGRTVSHAKFLQVRAQKCLVALNLFMARVSFLRETMSTPFFILYSKKDFTEIISIMSDDYITFLHEIFAEFGEITSRKMFGGYGIYRSGLMFGLVADDELFLKVDKQSIDEFSQAGLEAFEYVKDGKAMKMSYHRAPEEIFDDPEQANYWAALAYEAAMRSKSKK